MAAAAREREDWPEVDRIYSRPRHLGTMIEMRISMRIVNCHIYDDGCHDCKRSMARIQA